MENNKIHYIGINIANSKREELKDLNIIDATSKHMEVITYREIEELLKSIPEIHHSVIEQAIQNRNYELLGVTIVMAISQQAQKNITEAIYP